MMNAKLAGEQAVKDPDAPDEVMLIKANAKEAAQAKIDLMK